MLYCNMCSSDFQVPTTHLQGYPIDEVERVDDIPKGFTHLPAVSITHHRMQVHLERSETAHVHQTTAISTEL